MKTKSTKLVKVATLIIGIITGINLLYLTPTFAANNSSSGASNVCDSGAPQEVKDAAGCRGKNANALPSIIQGILSAIIGVAGLVSVVYIIVGGVQYMTSSGDASKTEKAKKTVLYACIGLIICALAFVIVNFVIGNILGQQTTSGGEASSLLPQPTELPIAFLEKQL